MYESKVGIYLKEEDGNEPKTSIEYYFINLPKSMESKAELISALVQSGNHDYFESLPIQTII